jgi:LysM repeat protein
MAYIDLPYPRSPRRHRSCVPGTLILSFVFFGATQARSQDVAEAARQERARKDAEQKKSKHVYTNDDLKHTVILTPEDREQLQAKKNQNSSPAEKPAEAPADSMDAQSAPAQVPLGDVARENRKQKLLRQKLEPQQSAEFHLPIANAPLAAAKPRAFLAGKTPEGTMYRAPTNARRPVFPVAKAPSNSLVIIRPPQRPPIDPQPFVHPLRKRSPFERSVFPVSPSIRPALKAPSLPTSNFNLRPVAPASAAVAPPTPAPKVILKPPIISVAPKPAASDLRIVVVQPGDSLWKLAKQNLGQGLCWHDLVAANPSIADPNHIAAGSRILVPASTPEVSHPPTPASKIRVQKGDTLWTLAQAHFGSASSWSCIARANPLLHDPNRIYAGQELLLPASCSASHPQRRN